MPQEAVPKDSPGEIWIEKYFAKYVEQCSHGDDEQCAHLVARTHFSTNDKESGRYFGVFETACENGSLAACGAHGRFLTQTGDVEGGIALLSKTCNQGGGYACAMLAESVLGDKGATQEKRKQAENNLEKQCTDLGGWPCTTLAVQLVKKDEKKKTKGYQLMERACRTGDPIACFEHGMTLADKKHLTKKEESKINELFELGCEADFAEACYNLAWRYFDGKGPTDDAKEGWDLVVKACAMGDAEACDHLTQMETRGREATKEAEAVFVNYCNLWGANACYNAAAHIVQRHGETAATAKELVRLTRLACHRGDAAGCNVLGHIAEDYIALCDKAERVRDTCAFAGYLHAVGVNMPRVAGPSVKADTPKAIEELTRSCDAGSKESCLERDRLELEQSE